MTTAYFLTSGLPDMYQAVLTDIADNSKYLWAASQPTFLKCLDAMEEFLADNFIVLYSKILTSAERDPLIDKELEGFILNHLEY